MVVHCGCGIYGKKEKDVTYKTRQIQLNNHLPGKENYRRTITNKFGYANNNWGFPSFLEFSELLNPNSGYMKDDKIIIDAYIKVHKVSMKR